MSRSRNHNFKNISFKFKDKKLIVATHNSGKLREIKELLSNVNLDIFSFPCCCSYNNMQMHLILHKL